MTLSEGRAWRATTLGVLHRHLLRSVQKGPEPGVKQTDGCRKYTLKHTNYATTSMSLKNRNS